MKEIIEALESRLEKLKSDNPYAVETICGYIIVLADLKGGVEHENP